MVAPKAPRPLRLVRPNVARPRRLERFGARRERRVATGPHHELFGAAAPISRTVICFGVQFGEEAFKRGPFDREALADGLQRKGKVDIPVHV